MSLGNDGGVPAVMNVQPAGSGYNSGNGWGGDWGAWIILFLIFGMFGWGGMGGFGGFGGFGGGAYPTEAILQRSLDTQTIIGKLDGVTQGLCDGFYAQNSALNGLGMNMMQGFHGVDNAVCTLGYQNQQGFSNLQAQMASCCCETQRAIDGINYNMATNTCALQNTMNNNTRDIIDNQNANSRAILDYLCQKENADLRAENQGLKLAASQANQNAVIGARIDAATAEILRRTGAECPTAAYIVQPPQPVSFATNCAGQATFNGGWGNGCGNNGCGCGSCGC